MVTLTKAITSGWRQLVDIPCGETANNCFGKCFLRVLRATGLYVDFGHPGEVRKEKMFRIIQGVASGQS